MTSIHPQCNGNMCAAIAAIRAMSVAIKLPVVLLSNVRYHSANGLMHHYNRGNRSRSPFGCLKL